MAVLWEVQLLGGPSVVRRGDTDPLRFVRRKTNELLAHLAFRPGQPQPRARLAFLLWPDASERNGRVSLSAVLKELRAALEPPGVPGGTVIVTESPDTLALAPYAVAIDVTEFEALRRRAAHAPDPASRLELLLEAADRYGGPLLPDFEQSWVEPEREQLASRYFQTVEAAVRLLEGRGDHDRAVELARRAVERDRWREDAHALLVRVLLDAAQPAQARHACDVAIKLLTGEGLEPSEALLRLGREAERAAALEAAARPGPIQGETRPAAGALPAGTVTFLVTDIEGSTALVQRLGAAYDALLDRHRMLLSREFSRHGGTAFKEIGDGFWVTFARAGNALACAVACQRALASAAWPESGEPPRVRMALHAGEAETDGGDYRGLALHAASRLLAAAHGGQILLSEAAAALARASLRPGSGLTLEDLGAYRLRDFPPQTIFQAAYPDTPRRDFPPPNADPAHPAHLPAVFDRFVGRDEAQAELAVRLTDADTRLLTLTGTGGTGKTRLAVEAARRIASRFPGGVWFISLAGLTDPRLLPEHLLRALGRPEGGREPLEEIARALAAGPALLILDNFEQLLPDGRTTVRLLLERVPGLTCLVTSRQPLSLAAEQEWEVSPLPAPEAARPERVTEIDSVRLFVDRARRRRPDFRVTDKNVADVAALCARLDGLPLALELAAAWAKVLDPARMLAELRKGDRFPRDPDGDRPDRHRSLADAFAVSYDLLPEDLRRFFARLAVFRGGWTLEAAEAVCDREDTRGGALDALARLREASLIRMEETPDGLRYRMLETVRDYAEARLTEQGRVADACRERHAAYFVAVARRISETIREGCWTEGMAELWQEIGNLRGALTFSGEHDLRDLVIALGDALGRIYFEAGLWADFDQMAYLLEEALLHRDRLDVLVRLRGLQGALARRRGREAEARDWWERRLVLCLQMGDAFRCADTLLDLAAQALDQGDALRAKRLLVRAIRYARRQQNRSPVALARAMQARIAFAEGNLALARRRTEQAEVLLGTDVSRETRMFAWPSLGRIWREIGELHRAETILGNALREALTGDRVFDAAAVLLEFGPLYERQGSPRRAALAYAASARIHTELGSRWKDRAAQALATFRQKNTSFDTEEFLLAAGNMPWQQTVLQLLEDG